MGTRSYTDIVEGDDVILRFYRQFDGYPSGHGVELAELADRVIVNGYGLNMTSKTHANGAGCLAAQIIATLKDGIGGIYIMRPSDDFEDFNYRVEVPEKVGLDFDATARPTLVCFDQDREVFRGDPRDFKAFAEKYEGVE